MQRVTPCVESRCGLVDRAQSEKRTQPVARIKRFVLFASRYKDVFAVTLFGMSLVPLLADYSVTSKRELELWNKSEK